MLRRHDEEGGTEQRVGTGGEDGVVDPQLLAAEHDLGALRAADPVLLHRDDVRRPADVLHVLEQPVGVVGDPEEPLLELARLDHRPAALAAAVDHLLVGEHRLVLRAPVDRRLVAVGQPALEQAKEQPLRPAVVARLVGAELARPVDRDAPGAELALELGDGCLGRLARMLAGPDRMVLGGQAEGVVAHRVQHPGAVATPEVGHRVARPSRSSDARCGAPPRGRGASPARRTWAARRRSFATSQVRSSAHTRCHLGSICCRVVAVHIGPAGYLRPVAPPDPTGSRPTA